MVENLLAWLRERQFVTEEDNPLDRIDADCPRLRAALLTRARTGTVSLGDLFAAEAAIDVERRKEIVERMAKLQRCYARSDELKLFRVENKSRRSIKVAAIDPACARMIALHHGHVQDTANAKVFTYKLVWLEEQRRSGSAIWRALKEGIPGVLKEIGNHAVIESRGKVYSPLSPISAPDPRFGKK